MDALTPQSEDRGVVQAILTGSHDAFDQVYNRAAPRIFRYASRRLGDGFEAEDVTQEVFLVLVLGAERFDNRSSLLAWLFGIARNRVSARLRRRRFEAGVADDAEISALPGREPCIEEVTDARRALHQCERAIAEQLSPMQRIVLLADLNKQTTASLAEALGASERAVKARLHRVRRTLRLGNRELDGFLG